MILCIPVSVGELFDKITILEIRLSKIAPSDGMKNVANELQKLSEIRMLGL